MKKAEKEEQKKTLIQLAIRELMMGYYKNVQGQRLVSIERGIILRDMHSDDRFQYQRQSRDMHQPKGLLVGDAFVGEMSKNPGLFVLRVDANRSPEMTWLVGGLTKFMTDYLPSVEISVSESVELGEVDDSKLLASVMVSVSTEQGPSDAMEAYTRFYEHMTTRSSFASVRTPNIIWDEAGTMTPRPFSVSDEIESFGNVEFTTTHRPF